jgi:hypothetical protein
MTIVNVVPNGTRVEYHGSLTAYHGEMTVEGFHQEHVDSNGEYSTIRYYLRYGPKMSDYLHNVRPESFTVMDTEDVHPEENGHA